MDVPHFCVSCSIVDDSCKLTSHPCCPILYHTQNGVVLSFTEKGTLSDVDGDPPQVTAAWQGEAWLFIHLADSTLSDL